MANIRKYLYNAIAMPIVLLLHLLALPSLGLFALIMLVWEAKSINKALKNVIAAPLAVLCFIGAIPALVIHIAASTLLTVAKIALFPEFFLSLWIKEGVKLSRVLGLSVTQFLNNYVVDFENFLEIKNKDRDLLVKFLKKSDFTTEEVISFYTNYSKLKENITTQIYDKKKSDMVLNLIDSKPLIEENRESTNKVHKKYKKLSGRIKIINSVDTELLKILLQPEESSLSNDIRIIRLSRVIKLFSDKSYPYGNLAENVSNFEKNCENFPKIKNNNRRFLLALLENHDLKMKKIINFYRDHLESQELIINKIDDEKKLKVIFEYLESISLQLLLNTQCENSSLFSIYKEWRYYKKCTYNIEVINDIDIELLKILLKSSSSSDTLDVFFTRLSRVIKLFHNNDLVKCMSDSFKDDKKMLAVQIAEHLRVLYTSGEHYLIPKENLKKFFLKRKDLIANLSSDFNDQSILVKIVKHFLFSTITFHDGEELASMLTDENVLKNFKMIDRINSTLADTLKFEGENSFLDLSNILYVNDALKSFLANDRLFSKLNNIPAKVLKEIFSTRLYQNIVNKHSLNEILEFFDCADDEEKNKNILGKLQAAFEADSEATHKLLNHKLFNSRDEIFAMIRDENFDSGKVREMLNNANIFYALKNNGFIREEVGDYFKVIMSKSNIINNLLLPNTNEEIYKQNLTTDIFVFLLQEANNDRSNLTLRSHYERLVCILKDYFFNALILHKSFSEALFSNISNEFRSQVINILFPLFQPEKGLQTTLQNCYQKILEIKFVELFIKQKYEEVTQESLAKIQNLTIKDLLEIPGIEEVIKIEEIEKFLYEKGIQNSSDLNILTQLIENVICIADEINFRLTSKEMAHLNGRIQTICDTFQDSSITTTNRPPSLLHLSRLQIIKNSLESSL